MNFTKFPPEMPRVGQTVQVHIGDSFVFESVVLNRVWEKEVFYSIHVQYPTLSSNQVIRFKYIPDAHGYTDEHGEVVRIVILDQEEAHASTR